MNFATELLLAAGASLLVLQGRSLLVSAEGHPVFRSRGVVTPLFASLILLASSMFATGELVLSPEFGQVLVQGSRGLVGLALLLRP